MSSYDFRQNNFDTLRLLAALQVAVVHGLEDLGFADNSLTIGILGAFPGVPIFFVISGFLISASYERSKSLTAYCVNRFLRIYPGLWVCFLVSLASVFALYPLRFNWSEFAVWVLAQLTVVQFYNPGFLRGYGLGALNGSLWTIPVELQFYILLPVLYAFVLKSRWSGRAITVLLIILVLINQFFIRLVETDFSIYTKLFGVTVLPYLYMFLIGVLLQRNQRLVQRFLAGRFFYWLLIFIAASYVLHLLGITVTGNKLNPLSALLLGLLVISGAYTAGGRLDQYLHGYDISYGLYIYHVIVINAFIQTQFVGTVTAVMAAVVLSLLLAVVSWKFVEEPCLRLKSYSIKADLRWLKRKPAAN